MNRSTTIRALEPAVARYQWVIDRLVQHFGATQVILGTGADGANVGVGYTHDGCQHACWLERQHASPPWYLNALPAAEGEHFVDAFIAQAEHCEAVHA